MREVDLEGKVSALIADLGVHGVWQAQTEALFDVHVIGTDAQSYYHQTVQAVLASAEEEKHLDAAEARQVSFTPFVVSVDGVTGREVNSALKLIAKVLSIRWGRPDSRVMGWVRATLSFSIT